MIDHHKIQLLLAVAVTWLLAKLPSDANTGRDTLRKSEKCPQLPRVQQSVDVISASWSGNPWPTAQTSKLLSLVQQPYEGWTLPNPPLFVVYHNPQPETAIQSGQAHLARLLRYAYGWQLYTSPGGDDWTAVAADMVKTLGRVPDALLFLEQESVVLSLVNSGRAGGALKDTKLMLLIEDPHWHAKHRAESERMMKDRQTAMAAADCLLAMYVYPLPYFFKDLDKSKMVWLPHVASFEFVLPMNEDPRQTVLLAGALYPKWYPNRAAISAMIKGGDTRFDFRQHPGYYGDFYLRTPAFRSKPEMDLAADFNEHLVCVTDGLVIKYIVAKVFEITATGCLLLLAAELAQPMRALGFTPGVHYVPYTMQNLDAVVNALLDPVNRPAVDEIRRNGQSLTLARHLSTHRANQVHHEALQITGRKVLDVTIYEGMDPVDLFSRLD